MSQNIKGRLVLSSCGRYNTRWHNATAHLPWGKAHGQHLEASLELPIRHNPNAATTLRSAGQEWPLKKGAKQPVSCCPPSLPGFPPSQPPRHACRLRHVSCETRHVWVESFRSDFLSEDALHVGEECLVRETSIRGLSWRWYPRVFFDPGKRKWMQ